jgi:diguanylate cyclase (GGDEF)-like protein
MKFADSDALNACPKLRERSATQASAVCIPVSFMGRALGVLHATGDPGHAISEATFDRLCTLGAQVGGRIGSVRAFERTQLQASTDALTGLANRRTLEMRMRDLAGRGEAFAFVLCDLDHFKHLNDTYGHPTGDEALRLFAEVVRASVRETDLPARWGGEEFAFVLAGMTVDDGLAWTQRMRDRLAQTLAGRSTPRFTASFGVVAASAGQVPEQLVRLADDALYRAKREGRDRAAAAAPPAPAAAAPPRESEHKAAVDLRALAEPH